MRPTRNRDDDHAARNHDYSAPGAVETNVTLPEGEQYQIAHAEDGTRVTWKVPEVAPREIEYDLAGRPIAVNVGGAVVERRQWRPDGQLMTATYESVALHFEYSDDGILNALLVTPPEEGPSFQQWLRVEIDPLGDRGELTDYSGADIAIAYDQYGAPRLWGSPSEDGKALEGTQVERDPHGNVTKIQTSWGDMVEGEYDAATGECKAVTMKRMGREAVIGYEHGSPVSIQGFDGGNYSFGYLAAATPQVLLREIHAPNGLLVKFEYKDGNRLSGLRCGDLYKVEIDFDADGRLVSLVQTPGEV